MRSLTEINNDRDFTNTYTAEFDSDTITYSLITPTSGKSLVVTDVTIQTEGATSAGQSVRLFLNTSSNTVFECYPTTDPCERTSGKIFITGARNEVLSITSTLGAGKNFFVIVNYKEV